jgi:predicted permease
MDTWQHDLRSALQALRRSPGLTLISLLSTALGIGMAALAFGAAYALLFRPLPFPDQDRLVSLSMERSEEIAVPSRVSYPEFLDFRAQGRSFAAQAVYRATGLTLAGQGRPERVTAAEVSEEFFQVLGVAPRIGRELRAEDMRAVVLGDALWRRRFGGDPAAVGRTLVVDEMPFRIVGVMPPGFAFPNDQAAWVPLAPQADPPREFRELRMIARLRSGVSEEAARSEVEEIGRRLAARYPASTAGWNGHLRALRSLFLSPQTRHALRYLAGASAFILLIACANLTHLLLVRRVERRQEMAVRAAFGAGPWRIARQIFTESFLLAGCGGAIGTGLATFVLHRFQGYEAQSGAPYWIRFEPGLAVVLFSILISALFALFLGLPAALRERRPDLSPVLKEASGAGRSRHHQRLRAVLVVTEVAVSVLLLTGASLTLRSLLALRRESGGVQAGRIVTLWTVLPGERYADGEARARRIGDVLGRLRSIPRVAAATASDDVPHTFSGDEALLSTENPASPTLRVLVNAVGSDYFRTLGASLVQGRGLAQDEIESGAGVAVVNEALERSVWPGGGAVGRQIGLRRGSFEASFTVVGVAADIRHRLLSAPAVPAVYVPLPWSRQRRVGFLLRTDADLQGLLPEIEHRVQTVDPWLPVFGAETLDELREDVMLADRQRTYTALLCGTVALFLALLGVYGVLSSVVVQQLRATGIRLALGATRWHVMRRIVGRGLALTLAGIVLGLAGSVAVGRFLSRFLYQVSPTDPLSFAGIAILVFDAAFIACYLPARRALEVDPVEVLREE